MTDVVISVEHLSKSYVIGRQTHDRYTTLRDEVVDIKRRVGYRLLHPFKSSEGRLNPVDRLEEYWALKDISIEVKRGDNIGIIGRNGAGKSTLLKVLSRITEPTSGRVEIEGRVASLLEVGTGFHPELTGRENIFLNGAILGMRRAEIKSKFDEIVSFSEVERFLDTPVKRYSSGMYVRLAFAVAAHLEPDILVVDEVLAVGDVQFQKKCLGKMHDVGKGGRTVIFVSHNMAAISNLCNECILLQNGRLVDKGETEKIITAYISGSKPGQEYDLRNHENRIRGKANLLNSVKISDPEGGPLVTGMPMGVYIDFDRSKVDYVPEVSFTVESMLGQRVFSCATYWSKKDEHVRFDSGEAVCIIPSLPLMHGRYSMNIAIGRLEDPFMDHIPNACQFDVQPIDYYGTGRMPSQNHGVILVDTVWK